MNIHDLNPINKSNHKDKPLITTTELISTSRSIRVHFTQPGTESPEWLPGSLHTNKPLCKAVPSWTFFFSLIITEHKLWKNLMWCKIHTPVTSSGIWQSDRCFAAAEMEKQVTEKWAEREDEVYGRRLHWQQRHVSRQQVGVAECAWDRSWGAA